MESPYTSAVLYHFVGLRHPTDDEANYETMCAILRSGYVLYNGYAWSPGIRTSINWTVDIVKGELVIPEVTCYCDIPFSSLDVHIAKYGKFGVGFARSFMVRKGARPVIYIPVQPNDRYSGWGAVHGVMTIENWKRVWDAFDEYVAFPAGRHVEMIFPEERPKDANEAIVRVEDLVTRDFFAYLKAFDCDLSADAAANYYMEREWRLVNVLSFLKHDVKSVIIPASYADRFTSDYPGFVDRLQIVES